MASPASFPRFSSVGSYWTSRRGLAALLVSLVLLIFVFLPLENSGLLGPNWLFIADLWFAGVIFAGASALGWRRARSAILALALGLVLFTLAVRLVARTFPERWTEGVAATSSVVVLSMLLALILAQVFRESTGALERFYGVVASYLLLGLDFAEAYRVVDVVVPGSLHALSWEPHAHNLSTFVYFSLCTLTTVGYGDIVPLNLAARALANMESILGQLFPALLIARLVSLSLLTPKPPAQ